MRCLLRCVILRDGGFMTDMAKPLMRALIQARMSSNRFPGKSLAPFRGKPLIWYVVRACMEGMGDASLVTVVTTDQPAERPLVAYLKDIGVSVFCGPADNVFRRYTEALWFYPCDWFFRVCGDSPLLEPIILKRARLWIEKEQPLCDIASNVWPTRQNPPGQSCEVIRTETFLSVNEDLLNDQDCEHVTKIFYRRPDLFSCVSLSLAEGAWQHESYTVDTIEDLKRLEH